MNNNEVFIVLAHLMNKYGKLNDESQKRIEKLSELLVNRSMAKIFFCGWAYRNDCAVTIASAQKKYFQSINSMKQQIYLIEDSRDTVGDAIFSRKFIEPKFTIKKINVITSNYHLNRTSEIFEFVYGENYIVNVIGVDVESPGGSDITEKKSLMQFRNTFSGIKKGDLSEIFNNMNKKHPFYNGEVFEK